MKNIKAIGFLLALCTAAALSSCLLFALNTGGSEIGTVKTEVNTYTKITGNGQPVVEAETVSGAGNSEYEECDADSLSEAAQYFLKGKDEKISEVCLEIYNGIMNYQTEIDITDSVIPYGDINDYITMIVSTSPEITQFSSTYTISYDNDNYATAITAEYVKTQETSISELSLLNSKVNSICQQAESLDDFEKVKLFHDALILGCEYTEDSDNPYSAYGCLVEGKAVCEGYSKAFLMLCQNAGIECLPVMGSATDIDGTVESHMWNMVKLDGEWYNVDVTWDDPITIFGSDYLRYDYLCVSDEEFSLDHTSDESLAMSYPDATAIGDNYFVHLDKYVDDIDDLKAVFSKAVYDGLQNGSGYARIKCADSETFDEAVSLLFIYGDVYDIMREVYEGLGLNAPNSSYYMANDKVKTITVPLS